MLRVGTRSLRRGGWSCLTEELGTSWNFPAELLQYLERHDYKVELPKKKPPVVMAGNHIKNSHTKVAVSRIIYRGVQSATAPKVQFAVIIPILGDKPLLFFWAPRLD